MELLTVGTLTPPMMSYVVQRARWLQVAPFLYDQSRTITHYLLEATPEVILEDVSQDPMPLEAQSYTAAFPDRFVKPIEEASEDTVFEDVEVYFPAEQSPVFNNERFLISSSPPNWDVIPVEQDLHFAYTLPPNVLFDSINDKFHEVLAHCE